MLFWGAPGRVLGALYFRRRVAIDPKKVKAMMNWLLHETVKQLKGFLGLIGYYRRFVKDYGKVAQPLIALCKSSGVSNGLNQLI